MTSISLQLIGKQNCRRFGDSFLAKPSRSDTIARFSEGGCKVVWVGANQLKCCIAEIYDCFKNRRS